MLIIFFSKRLKHSEAIILNVEHLWQGVPPTPVYLMHINSTCFDYIVLGVLYESVKEKNEKG